MGITKDILTLYFATAAGGAAVAAGVTLAEYSSQRTAVIQDYLSRQSEVTEATLEAADTFTQSLVSDPVLASICGLAAGFLGGTALYLALRKEDQEQ